VLDCPSGCTFGDGKTKLKPKLKNTRNAAFAEGGIEFGKLHLSTMSAKLDIRGGKLVVKKFDTKSEDGELHVDFDLALAQDIGESTVTGCLRFTGSQSLLKRDAKTHAALSTTGAPLGPDNLYHIRLDGKLKDMKRLPQLCGPGHEKPVDGDQASRPNLSIQPDLPAVPGDAGALIPTVALPAAADAALPPDAAVTVPIPGPSNAHPSDHAGSGGGPGGSGAGVESPQPPPPQQPVPEGLR
jgi:hypothetical protein